MKKNLVVSAILICLLGCTSRKENNQLKRIDFIESVSKGYETRVGLKEGEYLKFQFLNLYYKIDTDTSDYSRALFITIPVTDTAFTFKNDSTHLFQHLVTNCRGLCGNIEIEGIDNAEISGRLIGKDIWLIEAKTKYLDFKRTVPLVYKAIEKETIKL